MRDVGDFDRDFNPRTRFGHGEVHKEHWNDNLQAFRLQDWSHSLNNQTQARRADLS